MTLTHLRRSDYRVMPWKNGGGSTEEILLHPADAGVQDAAPFAFRVSLATVAASGPFSPFPGVDRTIVQLEGPAMQLDHGALGRHELTRLVPYRFPGDWETSGHVAGPARDLNVMTRRGEISAHVETRSLSATPLAMPAADWTIIYVVDGAIGTDGGQMIAAGETLVASGGALESVQAQDAARCVVATLYRS